MNKLLYTSDIPFDMSDWEKLPIKSVYAGTGCVMAITDDGVVLQKIKDKSKAARTEYWTRVKQISISKWAEGVAVGLVEDGTCLIAKRAARFACENTKTSFDALNAAVKEWKNIVQVEASDSLFALDSDGNVHYTALGDFCRKDYSEVLSWKGIKRIVTGTQNSIFGITEDGKVLCAGANCREKYKNFDEISDIVDVFPTGSECDILYFVHRNGSVSEYIAGKIERIKCAAFSVPQKCLDGTFWHTVYALTENDEIRGISSESVESPFDAKFRISSFAVGDVDYSTPFVLAIGQER